MARSAPSTSLITDARHGQSDDLQRRQRNYLISMAIRTACFLALVLINHPVRWLFLVGALILPMVAVLFVNQADKRGQGTTFERAEAEPPPAITAHAEHQVIPGEIEDAPGRTRDVA